MIWLTGIGAIAIVLAILQLDPNQLELINEAVYSKHWLNAAYISASLTCLCWGGSYFTSAKPIKNSELNQSITPLKALYQYGVLQSAFKISSLLFLWVAVLFNTVAQRVDHIESSPPHRVYVDAQVTPIGLSDKRMQLEPIDTNVDDSQKNSRPKVEQGYRQLVALTDIQIHSSINSEEGSYGEEDDTEADYVAVTSRANNPFYQNSRGLDTSVKPNHFDLPPISNSNKLSEAFDRKLNADLPTDMTVMLQSYQSNHLWLNDFTIDKQVRMQLLLTPLEFKVLTDPNEFNEYRWLSSRHATATAQLIKADPDQLTYRTKSSIRVWVDTQRSKFRDYFLKLMDISRERRTSEAHQVKEQEDLPNIDSATNDVRSETTKDKPYEQIASSRPTDAMAVTLSLLTGDRSLISTEITDLYRFAGISHLLAISGTHVLFLAMLGAAIVTGVVNLVRPKFYRLIPRWQLAFFIATVVAFGYAVFAGFDIPAARTAMMLLVIGILRYLLAVPAIFKVLLFMALGMAWVDVYVLWQAGYWLSFIAVAILVIYSMRWGRTNLEVEATPSVNQPVMSLVKPPVKTLDKPTVQSRVKPPVNSSVSKPNKTNQVRQFRRPLSVLLHICSKLKKVAIELFKLQMWMSVALLPLSLWLFGKVSFWGFIVNLFAIGLFGWVIVPLNLLAGVLYLLFPMYPSFSNTVWKLLFWMLETLHEILFSLQAILKQSGWIYSSISSTVLVLVLLCAIPWVLPKAMIPRIASLAPLLVISLITWSAAKDQPHNPNNLNYAQNLSILSLDSKNHQVSASVIYDPQHAWLLLSTYRKGYDKEYIELTPKEVNNLSQSLYDQLKQHKVDQLTGVIVQTGTPNLTNVVAKLDNFIGISHYWQAGLTEFYSEVTEELNRHESTLIPQSCIEGRAWHSEHKSLSDNSSFNLDIITGWEDLKDSSVWDCTIEVSNARVSTSQKVALELDTTMLLAKDSKSILTGFNERLGANTASYPLKDSIKIDSLNSGIDSSSEVNNEVGNYVDDELNGSVSTSTGQASTPSIIIFSSEHPTLAKLWQLMCQDKSYLKNQHLVTTSRASIDKSLLDTIKPLTWKVLDQDQVPANSAFNDTRLYWQQNHSPDSLLLP